MWDDQLSACAWLVGKGRGCLQSRMHLPPQFNSSCVLNRCKKHPYPRKRTGKDILAVPLQTLPLFKTVLIGQTGTAEPRGYPSGEGRDLLVSLTSCHAETFTSHFPPLQVPIMAAAWFHGCVHVWAESFVGSKALPLPESLLSRVQPLS